MTENNTLTTPYIVSGRPAATHLRDVRNVARQLVSHFVDNVVPCRTLPGDALQGEVTTVTRICLELAMNMLDGNDVPAKTERVQAAAAEWAREGIPIDAIQHAVHEGFRVGFDLIFAHATAPDYPTLVDVARRFMEILDQISCTVTRAYVKELRAVTGEHHTAVHTLTSALLGGHSNSTMARESGIAIADSYFVVALSIPPHRDEFNVALNAQVVARRKLRRVQAELATRGASHALSLLSIDGGTILLPTDRFVDGSLDELITQLSQAAQVPIIGTVLRGAPADIPALTEQAHELLDIVQRLRWPSRLHRFDELVLEYQLTRPGPARQQLATLVDLLAEYPDLLETLTTYIRNELNRQRTARALHVHANTVDHRFKRIEQITGYDPGHAHGLWYLRSALIARVFESGDKDTTVAPKAVPRIATRAPRAAV
ncbi:PucR family transcriptional regulator [Nocardia callitridis]|uniref:Helix-turn-helix domain-containing protein n=1 Tax=Nocardia callitridis TaxID=648753 RepID=A0ABP9K286_9NOCA